MKTKNALMILMLLLSGGIFAQGGRLREKKEQLKAVKVAFITEQVGLTSDEAEKFWPVYNAFDDQQFALRKEKMDAFRKRLDDGALDSLSDKEAAALLAQMDATETELYQLRKKLASDLRTILPAVKILKLKKAEEDFNRKLLQQYRNKKRN